MVKATTVTASQLLFERGAILKRCYRDKEHFIVEKNELPIVAIVPIEEYKRMIGDRDQRRS
jgi:hypothetical protein